MGLRPTTYRPKSNENSDYRANNKKHNDVMYRFYGLNHVSQCFGHECKCYWKINNLVLIPLLEQLLFGLECGYFNWVHNLEAFWGILVMIVCTQYMPNPRCFYLTSSVPCSPAIIILFYFSFIIHNNPWQCTLTIKGNLCFFMALYNNKS